ncbi:hypothetical protein MHU86_5877 [Fragilaria crotonensis]|nr:hypothetical protein MHU86_5877 [Fragilaria crotonensis]
MRVSSTCLYARILLITTIPIRDGRYFRVVDASSLATLPNKFVRRLNSEDNETNGDGDGAIYEPAVVLCLDEDGKLVSPDGTFSPDGAYANSRSDGGNGGDGGTSNRYFEKCEDVMNFGDTSSPSYPEQWDDSVSNISPTISPTETEAPSRAPTSRPTSQNTTRIPTTRRPTKRPTKAPTLAAVVVAPSGNNSSSEVTSGTTLVPTKEPDSYPPFNLDFVKNNTRHLIACQVSCALPPLRRHPHESDEDSQDESHDKPKHSEDDDGRVPHSPAYRFMFHVKQVMAHVIHERTNFTVIMEDKEDEEEDFDESDTDPTFDYRGGDVVLEESIPECNTTETERLVGEHEGVVWWMYTVSYYTNETNSTYIRNWSWNRLWTPSSPANSSKPFAKFFLV